MSNEPAYDPEYLRSRREALWILLAWAACLVWTVFYSALAGYEKDIDNLRLVMGIPGWVFWGVGVPWITATVFSIWFSLYVMRDEDDVTADDDTAGVA